MPSDEVFCILFALQHNSLLLILLRYGFLPLLAGFNPNNIFESRLWGKLEWVWRSTSWKASFFIMFTCMVVAGIVHIHAYVLLAKTGATFYQFLLLYRLTYPLIFSPSLLGSHFFFRVSVLSWVGQLHCECFSSTHKLRSSFKHNAVSFTSSSEASIY